MAVTPRSPGTATSGLAKQGQRLSEENRGT